MGIYDITTATNKPPHRRRRGCLDRFHTKLHYHYDVVVGRHHRSGEVSWVLLLSGLLICSSNCYVFETLIIVRLFFFRTQSPSLFILLLLFSETTMDRTKTPNDDDHLKRTLWSCKGKASSFYMFDDGSFSHERVFLCGSWFVSQWVLERRPSSHPNNKMILLKQPASI